MECGFLTCEVLGHINAVGELDDTHIRLCTATAFEAWETACNGLGCIDINLPVTVTNAA